MKIRTDQVRGTGLTTQQIKGAKQDALFIWCNIHTQYPKSLAKFLNRSDLKIVGSNILTYHNVYKFKGTELTDLVLDHAIMVETAEEIYCLNDLKAYIKL